jgi:hypothetical protein
MKDKKFEKKYSKIKNKLVASILHNHAKNIHWRKGDPFSKKAKYLHVGE